MMPKGKTINLLIILIMSMPGCVNISETGAFVDEDGKVIQLTENEVNLAQQTLLKFEEKGLPENASGGILFDGVLVSSSESNSGRITLVYRIEKILYGELLEYHRGKSMITIESPPRKDGGIQIQTGKFYRVYTVYLQGAYRTWAGTGTTIIK